MATSDVNQYTFALQSWLLITTSIAVRDKQ